MICEGNTVMNEKQGTMSDEGDSAEGGNQCCTDGSGECGAVRGVRGRMGRGNYYV